MQQSAWYDTGADAGAGGGAGGPGRTGRPLVPGARLGGVLVCLALLGVEIAWTVRDINALGLHDTVWFAAGLKLPGESTDLPATYSLDAVFMVLLLGALAASRRASAGWAFVTVGLFAVAFRVPTLWIYNSDWTKGAPLHDRALSTGIGSVAAGLLLVVIGLAGRRPATGGSAPALGSYGYGPADAGGPAAASGPDAAPSRPPSGAAIFGGLVALALALELIGWQLYYVQKYNDRDVPPHLYKHLLTGENAIVALLQTPAFYAEWVIAAVALALAVAAFARAPLARLLGVALGFLVLVDAVFALDTWHTQHVLFSTHPKLPGFVLAQEYFDIFQLVAGLLLIVLLAQRARRFAAAPPPAWGGPYGVNPGAAPAWGQPAQPPAQPPPSAPLFQPPQGPGSFGPPPDLPPPGSPGQSPYGYGYPPPPGTPPPGPSQPSDPR